MDFLPSTEEQDWILAGFKALVERQGYAPMVVAPVLEPSDRYFPDPWSKDGEGVWRLSQRLLWHAGLDPLTAEIHLVASTDMPNEKTAGLFAGIEGDRCTFAVTLDLVDTPDRLAATLAHETAHAYRRFHGLECEDRPQEEALTDLTAVFLGFGFLVLNASYQYRSSGEMVGAWTVTRWSHSTLGYLPPQMLAFALALVFVVRDLNRASRDHIVGLLEPNQKAFSKKALDHLLPHRDELRRLLAIPDPAKWPTAPVREAGARPIDKAPLVAYDQSAEVEDDPAPFNEGKPVFRVEHTRAAQWGFRGFVAGLLLCIVLIVWTSMPIVGLLALGLATAVGAIYGIDLTFDRCSDPACDRDLPPDATTCGFCGGTVSGRIKNANERLEAAEKLANSGRRRKRR